MSEATPAPSLAATRGIRSLPYVLAHATSTPYSLPTSATVGANASQR
jgi:hypothetical protein